MCSLCSHLTTGSSFVVDSPNACDPASVREYFWPCQFGLLTCFQIRGLSEISSQQSFSLVFLLASDSSSSGKDIIIHLAQGRNPGISLHTNFLPHIHSINYQVLPTPPHTYHTAFTFSLSPLSFSLFRPPSFLAWKATTAF